MSLTLVKSQKWELYARLLAMVVPMLAHHTRSKSIEVTIELLIGCIV